MTPPTTPNPPAAHRQLVGIDALRFAAACSVAIFHLGAFAWLVRAWPGLEPVAFPELLPVARGGWIGVEIFFVISGFVIAYSANGASPLAFARSRFLRLAPAAWICASVTLVAAALAALHPPQDLALLYAKAVLFWPGGPWIDGVYWTLGIEIAFYALVFALLACRAWSLMPLVVGAVGLVSTAFQIVLVTNPSLAVLAEKRAVQLALLDDGCLFALGAYLWLVLTQAVTGRRRACYVALIGLFVVGGLSEIVVADAHFMRIMGLEAGPAVPIGSFVVALALIVASIRWNETIASAIGSRGVALARLVGLTTYPFYLVHDVCGVLLVKLGAEAGLPRQAALGLSLAAVLASALTVTHWAEPWLRRRMAAGLARVGAGRPSVAVPEAA